MARRRARRFLSLNEAAEFLEVSREQVLILETEEEDFPAHQNFAGRVHWDKGDLEVWADEAGWFEYEDDEED